MLLVAAVWVATGLVLSVVMGRRGHAPLSWALLAVGSRGRGVSKLLLGSVAAQLARGSTVPVLIVTPPIQHPHRAGAAEAVGAGGPPRDEA
jgi:hypothetical protein